MLFGAGGLPGARPRRLDQMMFPIGDLTKDEVREHAKSLNLGVHSKPDSQEICFVPDDDYAGLLARRHPDRFKQGVMPDADGNERAGKQLLLPVETLAKGRRFNPQHSAHPKLVGHPHKH